MNEKNNAKLVNLTKEELELNLIFKILHSSHIEDYLEDRYDKFACEELSEEDVYFLLDKISQDLQYLRSRKFFD